MRILVIGDVVGKPGRRAVQALAPKLREELGLDMVIANAENIAGGIGMTPDTVQELLKAGVDVLTSGNHAWAKKEIIPLLESDLPIIRPVNYPPSVPGRGYVLHNGVLVVNLMGRVFMESVDDPFRAIDTVLEETRGMSNVIIVDCHTEATSEIGALGWYLNGRVSAVVGTHTHVGTVDAKILPKGTAFVTDIGMVGPRDSIIGNTVDDVLERFLTQVHGPLGVPSGPAVFSAVLVDVDESTGEARSIVRVDREVA